MIYLIQVICFFLMYADDTTLYCCLEDIASEDKAHTLNTELERVHSWLNANRLTLNVNETKYMLFRKRRNNHTSELTLRLNNNGIQSVTEFIFLGLYLNSKLKCDTHINVTGKKISRAVGIIKKLQLLLPKTILISLYNALVLPQCHILITVYFHGDWAVLRNLSFFSKRRRYVPFHLLVIMLILNRFSKFITF